MDEKVDQAKGEIKEQTGRVTGDESLEQEGKVDQAEGKAEESWDKAKDAAKDITR
ncbi:MAG: CsbD family protein [Actinobacteria bacterium]|nr:CsbD family protein [Actinomycetota bacterium]